MTTRQLYKQYKERALQLHTEIDRLKDFNGRPEDAEGLYDTLDSELFYIMHAIDHMEDEFRCNCGDSCPIEHCFTFSGAYKDPYNNYKFKLPKS